MTDDKGFFGVFFIFATRMLALTLFPSSSLGGHDKNTIPISVSPFCADIFRFIYF